MHQLSPSTTVKDNFYTTTCFFWMEFLKNWLLFYKTKHAFSTRMFITLPIFRERFRTKKPNGSTLEISDIFSMKIIIGSVPSRQFRRASKVQFCRLWNQYMFAGFCVLNHMLSNACKKYFSRALVFISKENRRIP